MDGYFVSNVGKHRNENTNANYVEAQGNTYDKLRENRQLTLF